MFRSSLGFHTLLLATTISTEEQELLIEAFKWYSKSTGKIKMFFLDGKGMRFDYHSSRNDLIPRTLKIIYYKEDIGLQWNIKSHFGEWGNSCVVEVKVNPKILAGIHDYLTAATYSDMEKAIYNFNLEASKISPLLKSFDEYKLNRIDYCVNLYLPELIFHCTYTPQQIMDLMKRGNIPSFFKEWQEYDVTAHRMKSKPSSFYLINKSVTINCYDKFMELQERSKERKSQGLSPIPKSNLKYSFGIIRFEVQCKYQKVYQLSKNAEEMGDSDYNKYKSLLTPKMCRSIIDYYYFETVGKGEWYDLQHAIDCIKSMNFNSQKEDRLISALKFVNQCRSLAKAKETYCGDLPAFKQTLNELTALNINPVTIPKAWGIPIIYNLLGQYYDNVILELWGNQQYFEPRQKDLRLLFD